MFITHNIAKTVFKLGIIALLLSGLNACQPLPEITNSPPSAATRAEYVLKQAQIFWPKTNQTKISNHLLQVAVLPVRQPTSVGMGGALGIDLNITNNAHRKTYHLQANQPGQEAAVLANVMALRVFLVDASLGTPVGSVTPYPSAGDVFTINTISANPTVLFTQVPTGDYHVCVSAFSSSIGPFTSMINLTSLNSASSYTEGHTECSSSGGDGAGSVSVGAAPTYTVSNPTPLSVNLNLKAATGAHVELTATVADG